MKKITIFFLAIMLLMGTVSLNAAEDGLYVGYSEADSHGYTEAKVTLEDGDIIDVELTEFTEMGEPKGEDYSYDEHHEAMAELPGQFVEANDHDVDTYSGATSTTDKASGAVKMALDKAEGETSFDGKYMGVSEKSDKGSFGVAWVTVEDGEITDITLEDTTTDDDDEVVFKDKDNYDYEDFFNAKEEMPERFKEANDYDVDAYSGATGSSELWEQAVARALGKAGMLEQYTGFSEADSHGYSEAKVTLEDGDIIDVELTEFTEMGEPKGEDYSYDEHHEAMAELPGQFVEANDHDVDTYSGATSTTDKASGAVKMALDKADGETSFAGKYMGVSEKSDKGSFGVAWVTVEDGEITDITLEDTTTDDDDEVVFKDKDNYDYEDFFNAKEEMPERFKEANDYDVDAYSGATGSSELWEQAVARALGKAGL